MAAPASILTLIDRFHRDAAYYRSGHFNEEQTRHDFLNPLLKALDWDIDNSAGLPPTHREVRFESTFKIGEHIAAPDYLVYAGGAERFYVEAKKPSINLWNGTASAYQVRRYAWSRQLPVSILTDFEELAIYDCRSEPSKSDKADVARYRFYTYQDYGDAWDEIAGLFHRDAVLDGSLERFTQVQKAPKGSRPVDKALLEEFDGWRILLARNIAAWNIDLSQSELNYAVQRTLNRILFLRICEDRGIEHYKTLLDTLNGGSIYPQLCRLFQNADDRYNSGLFHFSKERGREEPDGLTLNLHIDDEPLRNIIRNLYYPESAYEFSVLPVEVLGSIYEQFLGKIVTIGEGRKVEVEEKPEVRKAGGVYYTPSYVVDYIVKNTIGQLVKDKTPPDVSQLRVLDPACGSGSFLLGAYQYLLDWHRDWYVAHGTQRQKQQFLYEAQHGDWRLTIAERRRILLNNIYGVDVDSQAIEVTKLSLSLKMLEGETALSLGLQLQMFHERALPDLENNIKCGNSLIGPDFYDHPQASRLTHEELNRINVFNWQTEFPMVMQAGGFDTVLGNPPYLLLEHNFQDKVQLDYFRSVYETAAYKVDTYHLFIERGIKLTTQRGRFSMITPANFLTNNYLVQLRRFILENCSLDKILVIDEGVFRGVSVDNAIIIISDKIPNDDNFQLIHSSYRNGGLAMQSVIDVSVFNTLNNEYVLFTGTDDNRINILWKAIASRSVKLGDIADVNFGKQLRDRKKFPGDVVRIAPNECIAPPYKPCYTGKDISRYSVCWDNLICLDDDVAKSGGCWDGEKQNAINKLLTRQIGRYPEFGIDKLGYQCLNTMFMVSIRSGTAIAIQFLLGILNSKLIRALWLDKFYDKRKTFPKIKGTYLKELPIYSINLAEAADKARHDQMVALVGRILHLHTRLLAVNIIQEKTLLQRQIDATDTQIDRLVYELYGLTDAEIAIVEEATK